MKTPMKTNGSLRRLSACLLAVSLLATAAGCIYVNKSTSSSSDSSSSSSYSSADLKAEAVRTLSGEFPTDLSSLTVSNQFGPVRILAVENEASRWSWKMTVRAKTDELAKQWADATSCNVTKNGKSVQLALSLPESYKAVSFHSEMEIRVPKSIALRTQNRFGESTISGIAGDIDINGQNGAVTLQNVRGKVRAQTSFASMLVQDSGPAILKNQNGRIEVSNVHGPLEARTSFATLSAQNIEGNITARNQNGTIKVVRVKGNADLKTSFANLRAEEIQGDAGLTNQNGAVIGRRIDGTVNAQSSFDTVDIEDAGKNIVVRNQNGAIKVARIQGNADLKTSFGQIRAEGVQGDAAMSNQNGSVIGRQIGGSVNANSAFDTVDIEAAGKNIAVRNQNGKVRVLATSPELASIDLKTTFSGLELRLPAGVKPAIQAQTSFGKIESDFPVLMKPQGQDPFAGVDAEVPRITLQNQSGSIRVLGEKLAAGR